MYSFSIANNKGGVGKTTLSVSIAAELAKKGRVLLVDCDPQGNTTSGYGINKKEIRVSSYELLVGKGKTEEAIIKTEYKNDYNFEVLILINKLIINFENQDMCLFSKS